MDTDEKKEVIYEWIGDALYRGYNEVLTVGDDGKSYGLHSAIFSVEEDGIKEKIANAMNATYGAGINPVSVKEMRDALRKIADHTHTNIYARIVAQQALDNTEPCPSTSQA